MKVEQASPKLGFLPSRWLRSLVYKIVGGCLFSCGSFMTVTLMPALGTIKWMPAGGGWAAVVDAAIKGGLAGGLFGGLGPLIALGGVFVYNRGRRMSSLPAADVLRRDPRLPVLYLRSFLDDSSTAKPTSRFLGMGNIVTPATQEEQVVAVLQGAGPVVAVGQPGEALPELGAARLYLQDHEWKDEVSSLMQHSCLTAIRAGTSEGLLWEIQTAVKQNRPQQLVLLIPFDAAGYAHFSENVGHLFPQGMPDWPASAPTKEGQKELTKLDIKAIVSFDSSWQGTLSILQKAKASAGRTRPLQKLFATALQPVYRSLDIQPLPRSAFRKAASTALTVVGLAAGLIPGVMLGTLIGPALEPLAGKIYALHIFSKTRVQQVAEMPGPFNRPFSDEISRNPVVRTWFESASDEEVEEIGSRVADGMPRLSDELLSERAEVVAGILDSADTGTCAALIRSLAASAPGPVVANPASGASQQKVDLVQLIETYRGPAGVRQFAAISVKALESNLTGVPVQLPSQQQFQQAVIETLGLLSDQDRQRMITDTQHYASLPDEDLCWVERTLNHVRPRLSPASRSAMLRGSFGTKP